MTQKRTKPFDGLSTNRAWPDTASPRKRESAKARCRSFTTGIAAFRWKPWTRWASSCNWESRWADSPTRKRS